MNKKSVVYCIAIIVFIAFCILTLYPNYIKVKEKTNKLNVAAKNNSVVVVDLTKAHPVSWTKETLMGLFANGNELSIRVKSGGCTKKKDFWIWCSYDKKSKNGVPHYILTIYRIKKDECKAFYPTGILIKYKLRKELGLPYLYTYSVTNKVEVGPSPN